MAKINDVDIAVSSWKEFLEQGGDISQLQSLASEIQGVIEEKEKKNRVLVVTVIEMSEEMKAQISKEIAKISGGKVNPNFMVDKSILGGMKIIIGDKVIDFSLETKLQQLYLSLV